jgi:hypothetical protein
MTTKKILFAFIKKIVYNKYVNDLSIHVDLVEQTESWYFSIDSRDRNESLFKRKCGLLQRRFDTERISKSIELNSTADAKQFITHKITASALKIPDKEISFNPTRLLRDNESIFNTLRLLDPMEWKVIFRSFNNSRIILEKKHKEKKFDFSYSSILIKLRLKDHRKFIEVGEGSVNNFKFNQDGLISRVKKIVENHLNARPLKFPGKVPVILNAGDGAILFHELLGHSLEADHIFHRQSPITLEQIGKPIISGNITLVTSDENDTFFKDIPCDDEGKTPGSHILVEKGVLRNVISDCYYKNLLKLQHCGHSRVEDFSKKPMPRMYALYVKPGEHRPDKLITSTPFGVYAGEFGEGKVNFEKNIFYFHIREAWLIEKGKLTDPLGSIVVRGNILEALNSVEMVANDFRYDKGISYCFKNGQTLNVRVGQPSVKIGNLTVTKEFGF